MRPSFEIVGMLSASMGATFQLPSNVYSGSYTCCMIVPTRSAVDAMGSSVCGSATIARFAAPPLPGAADVGSANSVVTSIALIRALAAMERRTCEAKHGGDETLDIMAAPRTDGLQFRFIAAAVYRHERVCYRLTHYPNAGGGSTTSISSNRRIQYEHRISWRNAFGCRRPT